MEYVVQKKNILKSRSAYRSCQFELSDVEIMRRAGSRWKVFGSLAAHRANAH